MISFPKYSGLRCLMMPYIQGDSKSVPKKYSNYKNIITNVFIKKGDVGYLTIDESFVRAGKPHRGARSKTNRALHTEAGKRFNEYGWGNSFNVRLNRNVQVLLSSNMNNTCAVWDAEHSDTSFDGDIGYASHLYPYKEAKLLKGGEVCQIGILTPHESLPVKQNDKRQFLRIVGSGVYGREKYFTKNPILG
mgnify:CR=1 FL=1